MKTIKKSMLFLMMVSLTVLTGCSNDDEGMAADVALGSEFLTAKIDGADFAASQSPAVIIGAQNTNGILAVQGGDNNGNTINFVVQNYTGVGTYVAGDVITNTNFIQYLELNGGAPVTWASGLASAALGTLVAGTIEVTSDDGVTVEGTFTFEGYNGADMTVKNVTLGEFKALFD